MKHSDKNTAILMMTAFFLMFLVLWEAADLAARIEYQKKGGESYVYAQTVQLQFPEITELMENGEREQMEKIVKENLDRIFHAADMENTCNVSLTNLMLFVPSQKDSISAEAVIKENIPLPYHLQEKGTGPVLVGESTALNHVSGEENSRSLAVSFDGYTGEDYSIGGVLENYGISGQDDRIIMLYDRMTDAQKKSMDTNLQKFYNDFLVYCASDGIQISFGGESEEAVRMACDAFRENLGAAENVNMAVIPVKKPVYIMNFWYERFHKIFGAVSVFFALLNGAVVSGLWFRRHRKEYIIRLAFGYSGANIWKNLLVELGKLSLYPLLAGTVCHILFLLAKGRSLPAFVIVVQGLAMLGGTLAVLFLTVLFQYRKITGLDPAENLGRYGR